MRISGLALSDQIAAENIRPLRLRDCARTPAPWRHVRGMRRDFPIAPKPHDAYSWFQDSTNSDCSTRMRPRLELLQPGVWRRLSTVDRENALKCFVDGDAPAFIASVSFWPTPVATASTSPWLHWGIVNTARAVCGRQLSTLHGLGRLLLLEPSDGLLGSFSHCLQIYETAYQSGTGKRRG